MIGAAAPTNESEPPSEKKAKRDEEELEDGEVTGSSDGEDEEPEGVALQQKGFKEKPEDSCGC